MPYDEHEQTETLPVQRDELARIERERSLALGAIKNCILAVNEADRQRREMVAAIKRATMGHDPRYNRDKRQTDQLDVAAVKDFDAVYDAMRRRLDAGIWSHVIAAMGLHDCMDVQARDELQKDLDGDVAEATTENIIATLEQLLGNRTLIFQRGIARAFAKLDRRFKSHDAFALNARVILPRFTDDFGRVAWGGQATKVIPDIERAFALVDGEKPDGRGMIEQLREERGRGWEARQSVHETRYFRVRCHMNGNAHLWFKSPALVRKVNAILAAYYGEVLPDAAPGRDEAPASTSTAVAKDLQFYETPASIAEKLTAPHLAHGIKQGVRVLEPSAGKGALIRPLLRRGAHIDAIEVQGDRIDDLRALAAQNDGLDVIPGNFLDMPALAAYDHVVMNPPFYGTHWMNHVRHAFAFLKPGGILSAVLPVTAAIAETDRHKAFRRWAEKHSFSNFGRMFEDLPEESFAASGTRINTVILRLRKR